MAATSALEITTDLRGVRVLPINRTYQADAARLLGNAAESSWRENKRWHSGVWPTRP